MSITKQLLIASKKFSYLLVRTVTDNKKFLEPDAE